jgi:hypothetical protein
VNKGCRERSRLYVDAACRVTRPAGEQGMPRTQPALRRRGMQGYAAGR